MRPARWFVVAGLIAVTAAPAAAQEEDDSPAESDDPAPVDETDAPQVAAAPDEGPALPVIASAEPDETYPPPPPTGVYRTFAFTMAVGPGALIGPGEQDLAVSYDAFRVSWGFARNLAFFASIEGARAPSVNPHTRARSWLAQETFSLGVQAFWLERAYLRGSVGVGWVHEEVGSQTFSGGQGLAGTAAIGVELAQFPRSAVALELVGNFTRYPTESWGTAGLDLAVSFF
jgi:hypothetical protein